ncbi:hypothetical protein [Herbiconiux sp. UC225_62]|uniref:hypothetical protein n=1 Tax=Herbiconiux sp. UC225_62 TaxID=3350168 RepID=UPI0036D436DC
MEDRELYDIRSASRRVHRSRMTIYNWMNHGMPYQRIGGRRYIAHDDLLATLRTKLIGHRQQRSTGRAGRFSSPV